MLRFHYLRNRPVLVSQRSKLLCSPAAHLPAGTTWSQPSSSRHRVTHLTQCRHVPALPICSACAAQPQTRATRRADPLHLFTTSSSSHIRYRQDRRRKALSPYRHARPSDVHFATQVRSRSDTGQNQGSSPPGRCPFATNTQAVKADVTSQQISLDYLSKATWVVIINSAPSSTFTILLCNQSPQASSTGQGPGGGVVLTFSTPVPDISYNHTQGRTARLSSAWNSSGKCLPKWPHG